MKQAEQRDEIYDLLENDDYLDYIVENMKKEATDNLNTDYNRFLNRNFESVITDFNKSVESTIDLNEDIILQLSSVSNILYHELHLAGRMEKAIEKIKSDWETDMDKDTEYSNNTDFFDLSNIIQDVTNSLEKEISNTTDNLEYLEQEKEKIKDCQDYKIELGFKNVTLYQTLFKYKNLFLLQTSLHNLTYVDENIATKDLSNQQVFVKKYLDLETLEIKSL